MGNNPRPFKQIPYDVAARVCAAFGADQIVIVIRKEGDDGGICITNAGLSQHDALVSRSIADEIRDVVFAQEFGPSSDAEIDKIAREAAKEMREHPEGGDPNLGKSLIHLPTLDKRMKKGH